MTLNYDKTDKWGLPTVTFDATIRENEINMRKDMRQQAAEMLEKAGLELTKKLCEDDPVRKEIPYEWRVNNGQREVFHLKEKAVICVAHLSEIHKEVEKLRKGKLNNTWTQTVQRELETYSSDSEAFGGGKDIFYMAEGKGKGIWGLRNINEGQRVFGEIEGTHVGQIFKDRKELAAAGIHAPPMGGIWGSTDEGASSIVLSGGYEDDIDDWNDILLSLIHISEPTRPY